MDNDYYKRVAKIESDILWIKSKSEENIRKAYDMACKEQNKTDAALFARMIRNKLLSDSDSQMVLDRININTSSSTEFIDSLNKLFTGEWAEYRQALRDLPEQKGFPFEVEFPNEPETK